jgi:predicted metal-dependent hydrolase
MSYVPECTEGALGYVSIFVDVLFIFASNSVMVNTSSSTTQKITVRRIQFGHENTFERHWFRGNPFMTHFMNSLHSVFPAGERYFIRSVKWFDKQIQDPDLKERVKAFIGQEVQHGMQHEKFLKTLDEMGLDGTGFEDWYAKNAYANDETPSHESVWFGLLEKVVGKEKQQRIGLAITAALEHYTASIAETVLKHRDISAGMPQDMQQMFLWHAAEEIEHKSVAFDVFKDVAGGAYHERMIGFVFGSAYLLYYIGLGWGHYLLADKEMNKVSLPQAIGESIPTYFKLVAETAKSVLPYVLPDFHPDDSDNDQLAKEFFAESMPYIETKSA